MVRMVAIKRWGCFRALDGNQKEVLKGPHRVCRLRALGVFPGSKLWEDCSPQPDPE